MKDFYWLNKESRKFLNSGYLLPGTTPEGRIKEIADKAEEILGIEGFSDKFYGYMAKGYYSLATPVWMNFGLDRGLPISCYGIDIQDDTADIVRAAAEIGMLTKHGGGTAGFFGKLRHRGATIKNNGVSNGPVSFMELFQSATNVITQGQARRGYFAAYLNVDHPDIEEFLKCREEGHPIQDLAIAVTIPDYWMQEMIDGDREKRAIMAKIHKKRSETGFPYILFSDNVNKNKPKVYKDKNLVINHSQMCSEIIEYTDEGKQLVEQIHTDTIDPTDRGYKNLMRLMMEDGLFNYLPKNDEAWVNFLKPFMKLTRKEKRKL